jgi:hypothetical protein
VFTKGLRALIALLLALTASDAAAQTPSPGQVSPATPQGDDLTFADAAGNVLIGLTVRPAQPGPNTLLIYVLPLEGPSVAADVPISLSIDGQPTPVDFCSRTCRTADVTLSGGEHLNVLADSPTGGTVGFDLPALPAPAGNELLQQVQDRMHRLRTLRSDETLGPADPPIESEYAFQAPDRMRLDTSSGSRVIFIGTKRYSYDAASSDQGWQIQDEGVPLKAPLFVWDPRLASEQFVGAHVVGAGSIDGVDTQVVAFFENLGQSTPFWFRLWVDADGLVHRAEMRGQAHFMDERYTDFDAPFTIAPPT